MRAAVSGRSREGEPPSGIGGPDDHHRVRFATAVPHAVQRDPVVRQAFHRTWHLLDPPSAFVEDVEIIERVEAVWRDLQRDPPPPPGPDRTEIGRILANAE